MKIIGIRIDKGASVVIKNLSPGWYPFGGYEEPDINKSFHEPEWEKVVNQVYQIYPKLPSISVSCIVGKNGAGKTTMIEVMLRLVNNFAFYLLDGKADDTDEYRTERGRKLSYARGLYATMYFEVDGSLGKIECKDKELNYFFHPKNSDKVNRYNQISLTKFKNKGELLKNFFYTIECNYSQYGFRPSDYEPIDDNKHNNPLNSGVNGDWIQGLFHKNDGYLSPAVLTPFREDGIIDYVQEEVLANRRLVTLAILYYAQNKQFIPGYNPAHLTYEFDYGFVENQQNMLAKNTKIFNATQISYLIEHFSSAWSKVLGSDLLVSVGQKAEVALMYLGYKSLKICLKYKSYQRRFALKSFSKSIEQGGNSFVGYTRDKNFITRINGIVKALYQDTSHITLKIHQCIAFLRSGNFTNGKQIVNIDDYLDALPRYTYDHVFKALPPAYFKVELTMKQGKDPSMKNRQQTNIIENISRNGEFHFSQMSSGERQLMNSMSYVLYHIKNIQSIKADADRVAYHHINLIFDEAELYFHPDYQRYLVRRIIDMLHWCHIDRRRIRSVNIILATHSPYVLSDIFTQKSLYLKNGHIANVSGQSFGANYYNMLEESFFFEDSPMGEVATREIQKWIDSKDSEKARFVGDPIISRYLQSKTNQVRNVQDCE